MALVAHLFLLRLLASSSSLMLLAAPPHGAREEVFGRGEGEGSPRRA